MMNTGNIGPSVAAQRTDFGGQEVSRAHGPYAFAYLRYLAGERMHPPLDYRRWGETPESAAAVRARIDILIDRIEERRAR